MAEVSSPTSSIDSSQSNKPIRSRFVRPKPNVMGAARRALPSVTPPQTSRGVTPSATEPEVLRSPPPSILSLPPPITRSVECPFSPLVTRSISSEKQDSISKSPSVLVSNLKPIGNETGTSTVTFKELEMERSEVTPARETDDSRPRAIGVEASPSTSTSRVKDVPKSTAREQVSSRKRPKKKQKKPEMDKMTMQDLIYWNPGGSPMKYDSDDTRIPLANVESNSPTVSDPQSSSLVIAEESIDDPVNRIEEAEKESPSIGPQLKIGPDGNIIFDEKSLVIETSASKIDVGNSPIVHENLLSTKTYSSFRKFKPTAKWTDKQTAKFYLALSAVGTDFSMMGDLFPNRTRHELKLKYKREERLNRGLVHKAIGESQQFDFSLFNDDDDDELENEQAKTAEKKTKQQSKRRKNQKDSNANKVTTKGKRTRKKRNFKETDDNESEMEDSFVVDDANVVSDDEITAPLLTDEDRDEAEVIDGLLKTTRSGRQPKKNSVYNVAVSEKKKRPRTKRPRPSSPSVLTTVSDVSDAPSKEVVTSPSHVFLVAEKPNETGSQVVHVLMYSPRTTTEGLTTDDRETRVYAEMVPVEPTTSTVS